ncbi:transposase [Candidatus Contubernalis alkaliaceticus]|uniref:transposase n=1 Tax=Candidatus Contubernalis alkaliaceticus TaxID=338645 RepID=UPI001F4C0666|nr:transposase [Candidatus Contubernalis alkalaceticus]UNC93089.1 transposase [Candidatus Contubernalis alkalaceticus]
MARKPRIHYPGALYHVMVRGNNKEKVFLDDVHKSKYLFLLALYKEKLGFMLYAFCIMDNHAHLLIEVKDVMLSQIMQRVQQVYTQWFNRKYSRTGHVFEQRYKALLCDKDSYLLQLIRYIHYNPVRANLDDGIEYKWSSHIHYIGKEKGNLVDTYNMLSMFSENKKEAIKQYSYFMGQESEEKNLEEFQPKIQLNDRIRKKEGEKKLSIDEIMEKVCINENVNISEIIRKTRIQRISDIRKAIVLLSESYCNISNTLLAKKLNLPLSMISKIKSGVCKRTTYVEDVIRRWEGGNK